MALAANQAGVDVAVVGYGPVGVVAANLLGGYGIRTVVLERDEDIYARARAVTVNDWTMRIFQQMGLDEAAKAEMYVNGALTWKTYHGKTVFTLEPAETGLGHEASYMIYQPATEATLRRGVARFPGVVEVRCGETVTGFAQDPDGVSLSLDGGGTVRARYVLACDGGSSRMRAAMGAQMTGMTQEVTWIIIDAEVLRFWPGANELVFWSDPERPAVDIPLALGNHRWELPLRPDERPADFDSDEAVWSLLRPLGVTPEQIRLKQHAFYSHHTRRADRWRSGRVLLLGDAAHLMPPWAGQGMQSGIRDAHNVVWKVREILAGRLGAEILDTYQAEREPNIVAVTEMTHRLGMLIAGRDPKFVRARNTLGPVVSRLPALKRRLMPSAPPVLTAGWLSGAPGKRSAVGRMFPQPPVWNAAGRAIRLDDALGDGFAVAAFDADPRTLLRPADIAAWERFGARFLAIRSIGSGAHADSDLIDHTGTLRRWFTMHRARALAIRPDRFVAGSTPDGTALAPPTDAPARQTRPEGALA